MDTTPEPPTKVAADAPPIAAEPVRAAPVAEGVPVEEIATVDEPGPPPAGVGRTGVIWVHGIGSRGPGDTLFPWTQPILEVLAEWRRRHDRDAADDARKQGLPPPEPIGENPVESASVVNPENRWILVDVPASGDRSRDQWLFGEAFWAADVRPPSFGAAASYLLHNLSPIIKKIADGYGDRHTYRDLRFEDVTAEAASVPESDFRCAELKMADQGRWKFANWLDRFWQYRIVRAVLAVVANVLATTALVIYTALHAIPIPALQKRIDIAAADTFIVDWFADLAVVLDDQAQGAAVRTRVLERARWLRNHGCNDVVLLAHSGGTIVSYGSLLQYGNDKLDVAKLITFGEAIKLGWKLEEDGGDWLPGNSVRGNLQDRHPELRWVDLWASYDPAPGGPMEPVPGCELETVRQFSENANPHRPKVEVESRPLVNFMFLTLDHGGYWANDEGFLIPVIRHIDDPRGTGSASRFYRSRLDRLLRTERRRRRVALLLLWRWAALAAALASIAGLLWGVPDATATGNAVAAVWSLVPGGDIVSGVVDGIGNLVAVFLTSVGLGAVADWLGSIGPALLGTLVPILAVVAVFMLGNGSWYAHDALERRQVRGERLRPSGLASARAEATIVAGGLVAIVLASAFAAWEPVAVCLLIAVVVSGVRWLIAPKWDKADGDPASIIRVASMTRQL